MAVLIHAQNLSAANYRLCVFGFLNISAPVLVYSCSCFHFFWSCWPTFILDCRILFVFFPSFHLSLFNPKKISALPHAIFFLYERNFRLGWKDRRRWWSFLSPDPISFFIFLFIYASARTTTTYLYMRKMIICRVSNMPFWVAARVMELEIDVNWAHFYLRSIICTWFRFLKIGFINCNYLDNVFLINNKLLSYFFCRYKDTHSGLHMVVIFIVFCVLSCQLESLFGWPSLT